MKETKIYADEFCTTFASTTEMLEFLAERAKQSKWIRKTFRERKVKDILSALLFAMVYGVLLVGALSPAQNIINDIASGIGMGMATVVVAFVGLVEVKNRLTKRRNKREDADQEKSDTE